MNRRIVAVLSALLIVLQMVSVPLTAAFAGATAGAGCNHSGAVHDWHPRHCADDVASGGATSGHHPVGHECRCVHAVPSPGVAARMPSAPLVVVEAGAIAGRLPGPAYPAPLFDLLRPPN